MVTVATSPWVAYSSALAALASIQPLPVVPATAIALRSKPPSLRSSSTAICARSARGRRRLEADEGAHRLHRVGVADDRRDVRGRRARGDVRAALAPDALPGDSRRRAPGPGGQLRVDHPRLVVVVAVREDRVGDRDRPAVEEAGEEHPGRDGGDDDGDQPGHPRRQHPAERAEQGATHPLDHPPDAEEQGRDEQAEQRPDQPEQRHRGVHAEQLALAGLEAAAEPAADEHARPPRARRPPSTPAAGRRRAGSAGRGRGRPSRRRRRGRSRSRCTAR